MNHSDQEPINRRSILRAGALLGLGVGGILIPGAASAGSGVDGGVRMPDPVGAYDDPPARGVVLRQQQGTELAGPHGESVSPGMAPKARFGGEPGGGAVTNVVRQLHFRNSYGPRIRLCISYYSPGTCANLGLWGTRGWWSIDLGQSVHVLNTDGRWAYFFAEAADGAFWAGDLQIIHVPNTSPFDSCLYNQRIGDRTLGLRGVDLRADVWTVNLVP
ncbi:hypothetical protein GCM10009779_50120 [Polymorphospora rubra]|uniref:Uncharacterized protein n=1 Tax=Polymorphospora rubra TaxID=338584 RepID=A0A810N637_9ACTN|nr:DUF1036 domain-containing protein [Polymorphospora rubra]BCJ68430.1 hypothetical protein Prubr_54510 [Polymorphospora rubra]